MYSQEQYYPRNRHSRAAFPEKNNESFFNGGDWFSKTSSHIPTQGSVHGFGLDVRMQFVRKVYTILLSQIFLTTLVAGAISNNNSIRLWIYWNINQVMAVGLFGSLISMFALFYFKDSHPKNLILLSSFTFFEALTLGTTISFLSSILVYRAAILTVGAFIGLTMYTFQSRRDFSELGSILSLGLYGLVFFGAVQMFLPFSDSLEFIKSFAALLIFSGYIVYDTSNILYRYRPDQYVIASMSLYLDVLNLFMQILKVLSKNEEERNRKKSRKDRE